MPKAEPKAAIRAQLAQQLDATTGCGIAELHAPGMHPTPEPEDLGEIGERIERAANEARERIFGEPDEDERSSPDDSIAPGILLEMDRKNGRPKSKGTKEIRHEIIEEEVYESTT